jgi:hypothetical protein
MDEDVRFAVVFAPLVLAILVIAVALLVAS